MSQQSAYLIISQYNEQKSTYTLVPNANVKIGRSPENNIVLNDDRCSRQHAEILWNDGQWLLSDLGSRNGTLLDGKVISDPTLLLSGSTFQIGHFNFQFVTGQVPKEDSLWQPKSGVFGVQGDYGPRPRVGDFDPSTIVHHRNTTSFFDKNARSENESSPENDTATNKTTRFGHGAADLCRLAFSLGKAGEVDLIGEIALDGLLQATDASGAGLWLFPYTEKKKHTDAADLRLIKKVTNPDSSNYIQVSEALAKAVLDRKEGVIVNEELKTAFDNPEATQAPWEGGMVNNTVAAPIRLEDEILGLLHLYTTPGNRNLELDDLEYTLAVADTVAAALGQLNMQKELAANLNQARKENSSLREMLHMDTEIIGNSKPLQQVGHLIARAAAGKASLLIRGESGTGKELIAKAVHLASPRKNNPLICINCAAIAESLLASELFGHEKGAFTGATDRKAGKFEAAHTGTLFLDEIGEMPILLQSKLLRILEGHPFERVGGNMPISVDVRVLAATNRDLEKEVAEGRFRHDLFFRLRVLEIIVPPLRKRKEDIAVLATHFLDKFGKETGRKYQGFSPDAMNALMSHRWPGNVRELKNVVERAVVLGAPPWIQANDLLLSSLSTTGETDIRKSIAQEDNTDEFTPKTLEQVEKLYIERTLEHTNWNKSLAARMLGIERTTLDRKIKRYSIEDTKRTMEQ